jgi:hypothetical protein
MVAQSVHFNHSTETNMPIQAAKRKDGIGENDAK